MCRINIVLMEGGGYKVDSSARVMDYSRDYRLRIDSYNPSQHQPDKTTYTTAIYFPLAPNPHPPLVKLNTKNLPNSIAATTDKELLRGITDRVHETQAEVAAEKKAATKVVGKKESLEQALDGK